MLSVAEPLSLLLLSKQRYLTTGSTEILECLLVDRDSEENDGPNNKSCENHPCKSQRQRFVLSVQDMDRYIFIDDMLMLFLFFFKSIFADFLSLSRVWISPDVSSFFDFLD